MKEGWKYKKLGEVCMVISGQSPEGKYYNSEGKGTPFYQGKKDFTLKYIGNPTMWTTEVTKIAEKDDLLMSVRAPVGDVNFATQKSCIGRGLAAIRAENEIDKEYLFYFLLAKKNEIKGKEGVGFSSINRKEIMDINISFPNEIAEQRSIVSRLDAAFAKIDALKANAERQLAEAHALFNRALTEEMTPKEGWEEKMFGEVGTFIRGINFLKNDFIEEGFPCIHYGQIHTKLGVVTHKHLTCIPQNLVRMDKLASKGDIIIAITSEDVEASCKCTAWLGDYDIAVGAHAAIYKHRLNPTFVSYYMKSARFQKEKEQYVHGFKVMEIKPSDIAKISIAFPSETSQKTIVSRLDALSANVRKMEELLRKTLLECDALKQSMLKEVFE